ncbi:MAG TPA: tRNA (guanosine(37)-N1)-methyltransferase TrmD [Thermoanaerobaculia bacterium]|nr:tRNA (guanosine(37)-N1)-methyltransferase TrmD [Thermoanaerobaculia bacterium]
MRFDVLSIFPRYFDSPLSESLLGKAREKGIVEVVVHDIRAWAGDPHRKVDDEPYGGGAGMVMMAPVVAAAIEAVRDLPGLPRATTFCLTPDGRRLDHAMAAEIAALPRCVLVCGRYEGIDHRVAEAGLYDGEISLGDFVLSGGEVAALAVIEASARLAPGFVKEAASVVNDSFYRPLLDHPHYTRPAVWRGLAVPDVLLSGHHGRIEAWRREQAERRTRERRPDLLPPED